MTNTAARTSKSLISEPLTVDRARINALIAIENYHRASIERTTIDDIFSITESFRRPDGIWWIRAFSRIQQREVEKLVVPNQQFTRLKAGTTVVLTKIVCGECVLYEATLA